MTFRELALSGALVLEPERLSDERGFFARTFCEDEFQRRGIDFRIVQTSISFNARLGTVRGMHFQAAPFEEAKLVRCTMGAIYDVLLDLRAESPTYGEWTAVELSAENRRMVFVPKGCAHGFQTLVDACEVLYCMSEHYRPEFERGVRWSDPAFRIVWPLDVGMISRRDAEYPDFLSSSLENA